MHNLCAQCVGIDVSVHVECTHAPHITLECVCYVYCPMLLCLELANDKPRCMCGFLYM